MADVLLGLEVIPLNPEDPGGAPWRMTVDVWDSRKKTILRYQLTGPAKACNVWPTGAPERTLEELARVQYDWDRKDEIAAELDRLDRETAKEIEPIMERLFRDQVRVLHGEEGLKFLDKEKNV